MQGLETKGGDSICLANSTLRKLRFVMTISTVRKKESSDRAFGIGFQPAVLGFDLQVGSSSTLKLKGRRNIMACHQDIKNANKLNLGVGVGSWGGEKGIGRRGEEGGWVMKYYLQFARQMRHIGPASIADVEPY